MYIVISCDFYLICGPVCRKPAPFQVTPVPAKKIYLWYKCIWQSVWTSQSQTHPLWPIEPGLTRCSTFFNPFVQHLGVYMDMPWHAFSHSYKSQLKPRNLHVSFHCFFFGGFVIACPFAMAIYHSKDWTMDFLMPRFLGKERPRQDMFGIVRQEIHIAWGCLGWLELTIECTVYTHIYI